MAEQGRNPTSLLQPDMHASALHYAYYPAPTSSAVQQHMQVLPPCTQPNPAATHASREYASTHFVRVSPEVHAHLGLLGPGSVAQVHLSQVFW